MRGPSGLMQAADWLEGPELRVDSGLRILRGVWKRLQGWKRG